MFGSIGWAVTMFTMGMVLDHSRIFQEAKCDANEGQRNYNVCFSVFAILMGCALLVGFMIPFKYKEVPGYNPNTNANMPMNNIGHGQQGELPQLSIKKWRLCQMFVGNFVAHFIIHGKRNLVLLHQVNKNQWIKKKS